MADGNILSNFGIDLLEEEIDDVIFQTNEFLTDATFTGAQGPFWWILQMCMALAALFAIIMTAGMAYKMMVKHEPLDIMKLFRPLAVSLVLCWWYPPADTGMAGSGSNWCFLDFLSYIPNSSGRTPTTSIRRKPRKSATSSRKRRNSSLSGTRCTPAYRRRRTWPIPEHPTRT